MEKKVVSMQLTGTDPLKYTGDLLVYLVEEETPHLADESGKKIVPALQQAFATGDFKGKKEQIFLLYPQMLAQESLPEIAAQRLLFAGLGKADDEVAVRRECLRLVGGQIAKKAAELKAKEVLVVLPKDYLLSATEISQGVTEGLLLGNYQFIGYKTKTTEEAPGQVEAFTLHDGGLSRNSVRKGMQRGLAIAEATAAARDMANHPANNWTPGHFAEFGKKISKKNGLKCKVLDKASLRKLAMGGLLGVSQGSDEPPVLVALEYKPVKEQPTILLVGKGLTFDSGGICTKPAAGMDEMKYDMCGGAAVIAAMQAVAELEIKGVNVVGLIPASENLSGAAAFKPGDVICHYGGKTSEITNTDAEGRLILADAIAYGIETYKPTAVLDLATLTGAVIVGLGHHYTGLMSNNDQLAAQILDAGQQVGEPLWRLPLGPEYRKQLDSRIADIKNAGDRKAGAITAGCYLQEFVGETPWAHLDIAGTAWDFTAKSYIPKGPSGTGVRTLISFLSNWQALKPLKKK